MANDESWSDDTDTVDAQLRPDIRSNQSRFQHSQSSDLELLKHSVAASKENCESKSAESRKGRRKQLKFTIDSIFGAISKKKGRIECA